MWLSGERGAELKTPAIRPVFLVDPAFIMEHWRLVKTNVTKNVGSKNAELMSGCMSGNILCIPL